MFGPMMKVEEWGYKPYQPVGDLWLSFSGHEDTRSYRRELNLDTVIACVTYQVGCVTFTREVFPSPADQAIVVRLTADKPGKISFTAKISCSQFGVLVSLKGLAVYLSGSNEKHRYKFSLKGGKMARVKKISVSALLGAMIVVLIGCAQTKVKRVGMVIGVKPEKIAKYKKLHAESNPGVRDLLNKYNMHNFSIYLHEIDGKYYEFGYYEYTGNDYEGDMAKLAAEPRPCRRGRGEPHNKKWLSICDPMQIPLKGYKSWAQMEEVYHND